jgi:hypothetical protein
VDVAVFDELEPVELLEPDEPPEPVELEPDEPLPEELAPAAAGVELDVVAGVAGESDLVSDGEAAFSALPLPFRESLR